MKIKLNEWINSFINSEFFIQNSMPEHGDIYELIAQLFETLKLNNFNFLQFWDLVKDWEEIQTKANFFEKAEISDTDASEKQFTTKIFVMTIQVLFKVCKDYFLTYKENTKHNLDAVTEHGMDASIEKTFLQLSNQYQNNLLKILQDQIFLPAFDFFKTSIIELINKNLDKSEFEDKQDAPYLLMELLSSMIDSVDDMEINLEEEEFDAANAQLELLVFFELLFDRLILLAEHIEYNYLKSKAALDQFNKVNIMERYEELIMLENLNDSKK